ncbi:MAG TPA: enolase C-terminal domain-like protein [Kofleriaceae bacterium]
MLKLGMLSPFAHAAGRRSTTENLVVIVEANGVVGLGEGVPRQHVTNETVETALAAMTRLDVAGLGEVLAAPTFEAAVQRVETLALAETLAAGEVTLAGAAACAVELAVLDAIVRRHRVSLVELPRALGLPPGAPRDRYPLMVTLDLDRDAAWLLARWPSAAPRQLKIKMGVDADRDVERARGIRAAVGPEVTISVDTNMAWSLDQACEMIARLAPFSIAWYEEPLARRAFADYAELRRRTSARVMLDESICSMRDLEAATGACDLVNVKLSKCGGMIPALRLAHAARDAGLGVQLGAMVGELGVLAAARRRIAAMTEHVALDAPALYRQSIVREDSGVDYLAMTCGDLPGPGLGVTPNEPVIERHTSARRIWSEAGWS